MSLGGIMGTPSTECKNRLLGMRKMNSKLFKGKDKKAIFDKRYKTNWTTIKKYDDKHCHCIYCAEYAYLTDKYGCK
jgi:hypothetical protein